MICRNTFVFIMLLACVAYFSPLTYAASFSTQDLTGTWYGHHVVTGDAPGDDPRWGYGSVGIDGSGNYTATWTSPTRTDEVSAGTIQINTTGLITVDNQSLTHGVMNDDKDLIVFIDGTNQSQGNALTVMVKRSPATNFSTSDFAGSWYGHHVVTGDAPGDDPRWGYGSVGIDGSGNYMALWTSPTQTDEVSAGTIQINTTGLITVNNQSLTHGVMNDNKDLIVFIDGTNQSQGNALTVMVKRSPATNFSTSDFAGTWYGHQVVSGDAPGDEPRWGYGSVGIDGSGNYTATWTSLTQTDEVSAGTIQINTTGLITVNNQSLTHGVMNDNKDLIVFIDGTNQSQGNALTVMVKRSPLVQPGLNLLLLNRPTK